MPEHYEELDVMERLAQVGALATPGEMYDTDNPDAYLEDEARSIATLMTRGGNVGNKQVASDAFYYDIAEALENGLTIEEISELSEDRKFIDELESHTGPALERLRQYAKLQDSGLQERDRIAEMREGARRVRHDVDRELFGQEMERRFRQLDPLAYESAYGKPMVEVLHDDPRILVEPEDYLRFPDVLAQTAEVRRKEEGRAEARLLLERWPEIKAGQEAEEAAAKEAAKVKAEASVKARRLFTSEFGSMRRGAERVAEELTEELGRPIGSRGRTYDTREVGNLLRTWRGQQARDEKRRAQGAAHRAEVAEREMQEARFAGMTPDEAWDARRRELQRPFDPTQVAETAAEIYDPSKEVTLTSGQTRDEIIEGLKESRLEVMQERAEQLQRLFNPSNRPNQYPGAALMQAAMRNRVRDIDENLRRLETPIIPQEERGITMSPTAQAEAARAQSLMSRGPYGVGPYARAQMQREEIEQGAAKARERMMRQGAPRRLEPIRMEAVGGMGRRRQLSEAAVMVARELDRQQAEVRRLAAHNEQIASDKARARRLLRSENIASPLGGFRPTEENLELSRGILKNIGVRDPAGAELAARTAGTESRDENIRQMRKALRTLGVGVRFRDAETREQSGSDEPVAEVYLPDDRSMVPVTEAAARQGTTVGEMILEMFEASGSPAKVEIRQRSPKVARV